MRATPELPRLFGGFGAGAYTRRFGQRVAILDRFRRYAECFFEVLILHPVVVRFEKDPRLRIKLRIFERGRKLYIVLVGARVTLFYVGVFAARMAVLIEPGSFVEACAIDHEGVVAIPVAGRISVITGIGRAFDVYVFGKLPAVHPDFTPYALLLKHDEHAVLPRLEEHSPSAAYRVVQKIARKP